MAIKPKSFKPPHAKCRKQPRAGKTPYTYRWQQLRRTLLLLNPICAICLKNGRITQATEVDHIIPHKGDMLLFWDTHNMQNLCETCHARKTANEDGGFGRYNAITLL